MTIPEIRAHMAVLSDKLATGSMSPAEQIEAARWLRFLANETKRRAPVHRAKPRPAVRVTKAQLLAYFATHPGANYMDASLDLNVKNTGRISETMAGFRR